MFSMKTTKAPHHVRVLSVIIRRKVVRQADYPSTEGEYKRISCFAFHHFCIIGGLGRGWRVGGHSPGGWGDKLYRKSLIFPLQLIPL